VLVFFGIVGVIIMVVVSGVMGIWMFGVMVDVMWLINEICNVWFYVIGGVWKKIFNGIDGVFMVLCIFVV